MAAGRTNPSLCSVCSPIRLTRPGARKIRGLEAKRAENDWARRSGASRVVGWPVVFCIAQCVPLAGIGEAAGRPRRAIGRKKKGTGGKERERPGEIASVYTRAAAQTKPPPRWGYLPATQKHCQAARCFGIKEFGWI